MAGESHVDAGPRVVLDMKLVGSCICGDSSFDKIVLRDAVRKQSRSRQIAHRKVDDRLARLLAHFNLAHLWRLAMSTDFHTHGVWTCFRGGTGALCGSAHVAAPAAKPETTMRGFLVFSRQSRELKSANRSSSRVRGSDRSCRPQGPRSAWCRTRSESPGSTGTIPIRTDSVSPVPFG